MTEIKLYWSNICVLHRQEQQFLDDAARDLARQGIRLTSRFFGIGYPQRLSQYFARPDAELPDVMVSTDLEVFEDSRIYERFVDRLYPAARWAALKENHLTRTVFRDERLLPYVAIPLVFYTRDPSLCEGQSLGELIGHQRITFGGINNSGVKVVLKAVWDRYGEAAARTLLQEGEVTDMPIQAFQRVRTGQSALALVPTLYALRADEKSAYARCPADGAVLLPSYICAFASAKEAAVRTVIQALTAPEICARYVSQGDLLCAVAGTPEQPWMQARQDRFLFPSPAWFDQVMPEDFYRLYRKALPNAWEPFLEPERAG